MLRTVLGTVGFAGRVWLYRRERVLSDQARFLCEIAGHGNGGRCIVVSLNPRTE